MPKMSHHSRDGHLTNRVRANENGTYTFPLSSEAPYRRYDGDEILVHSPEAVDLSFLNSGTAPLLDSHKQYGGLKSQLGVVTRAWLKDKRLYVDVKFSNREDAQDIRRDVDEGIVSNVSVGYDVHEVVRNADEDSYRVTKWTPKEASLVSIPADETVGIGRSATRMEGKMPEDDKNKPAAVLPGTQTDEQRAAEFVQTTNEITTLAAAHNMSDLARSYLNGVMARGIPPSLSYFKGIVVSNLPEGTPLVNNDAGLTQQETRTFSLRKLVLSMCADATRADKQEAAFELEATDAMASQARDGRVALPPEVLRSFAEYEVGGLLSTDPRVRAAMSTSGNANVQSTDHLAGQFIYNLRNRMVLGQLGLTMLNGLDGNVDIPGGNANIAAAWLGAEDANAAESNPSFRKVSLSIHDVATYTDMTRRMLLQSTIAIEAYVRMQILEAMAQAIDLAGFYGTGASGQPTGLAITSGIGSVEFAAEFPTRGEIIDMRTAIATTNQTAAPVMVSNSEMVGELMKTKVDAGSGRFLMENRGSITTGDTLQETNQIVSGDLFAGVWSDMMMGTWGTLELDRSTEAKFLSGGLRLRAIQSVDFGVRRLGSFVLGNDGV